MKYLLDTNIMIAISRNNPVVMQKMQRHKASEFVISSIVYFELAFGAFNSTKVKQNLEDLYRLPFQILDFNQTDGVYAGQIRSDLKAKGTPIGPYDTLIAGQTLANDLILITDNIKEFERVDGLKVENWLQ